MITLFLINVVTFLKVLFASFSNSKFWFPEFVSSYARHITEIGGAESWIEITPAPN